LIDKASIEDVICHTSEPNLDYIASGPPPPNPSELIMLPKMNAIIEELKKTYDAIIIDSPPTGLVTDGILLMKNVDIPIYVLRAEYSKKSFVKSLSKLKQQSGVDNLSLVLNGVKRNGKINYGYGYGYYEEKKPKSFLARFF
jgi:capsular exopolysaccharide synthesis family protein